VTLAKRRFVVIAIACAMVGGVCLFVWHSRVPVLYRVTVLPALSSSLGGQSTCACAVNDVGQVAGVACTGLLDGEGHVFLWDRNNGVQDLGLIGLVAALDNDGRVCGTKQVDPNHWEAFLSEPGKGLTLLGTLGHAQSWGLAMNNRGQIVGTCEPSTSGGVFLWGRAAGMRELKVPSQPSWPKSINDAGSIIVGSSSG
jgi:uncharacterized membrane protein